MTKTRDLADWATEFPDGEIRDQILTFTQSGTGAEQRTVEDKLKDVVSVKDFGAVGDGTTDDTTAIQAAIDYVETLNGGTVDAGGGAVYFPTGIYVVSDAIVLKDGVVLYGDGHKTTRIKKSSATGAHWIIETVDFDTLSGTNAWFTSEGVPTGFGIKGLRIDGNAFPPTTTNYGGVRFYGKRFTIDDVYIQNVNGVGLHTECGQQVGQVSNTDIPETAIGNVWIRRSGSTGWLNRGPHDMGAANVYIANACFATTGGVGLKCEELASNYKASGEIDKVHVYGTKGTGVEIGAPVKFNQIISESNDGNGVVFTADATNLNVDSIQVYTNNGTTAGSQVEVQSGASNITIGGIFGTGTSSASNGISCAGSDIVIDSINIQDTSVSSTESGLKVEGATNCRFSGILEGFDRSVYVHSSNYCTFDINSKNPASAVFYLTSTASKHCSYSAIGSSSATVSVFAGTKPNTLSYTDRITNKYNIRYDNNGTSQTSYFRSEANEIDVTSTGQKTFSIAHNLVFQPRLNDCVIKLSYIGGNYTHRIEPPYITQVSGTTITAKVNVTTAFASSTVNPQLYVEVSYL